MPPLPLFHGTTIPMSDLHVGMCPQPFTAEHMGKIKTRPRQVMTFSERVGVASEMAAKARDLQGIDASSLFKVLDVRLASTPGLLGYLRDVVSVGLALANDRFLRANLANPRLFPDSSEWAVNPECKELRRLGLSIDSLSRMALACTGAVDRMTWLSKNSDMVRHGPLSPNLTYSMYVMRDDVMDAALQLGVDCRPRIIEALAAPRSHEFVASAQTMHEAIGELNKGKPLVSVYRENILLTTDLACMKFLSESILPAAYANSAEQRIHLLNPEGMSRRLMVPAALKDDVLQGQAGLPWKPLAYQVIERGAMTSSLPVVVAMLDAQDKLLRLSLLEEDEFGRWLETPQVITPGLAFPPPMAKPKPVAKATQPGLF